MKIRNVLFPFVAGIFLTLGLLWMLSGWSTPATAAPAADIITVCPAGPPTCTYTTIQDAVDAAHDDDVIKVATGIYTGVHVCPRDDVTTTGVVTQVVYVTKTVTIRGGYTTTASSSSYFTGTPNPDVYTTTLDAEGQGRVFYITGGVSPTLKNLRIIGGDADGLGGMYGGDAGGGVYAISATVTLSGNVIYSNTAGFGGGVYVLSTTAVLSGNVIYNNRGLVAGGGVYVVSTDATLIDNVIHNNITFEGGGVFLHSSDDATLNGNTVYNNMAFGKLLGFGGLGGGGIFLEESDGARLSDNVIHGNIVGIAPGFGGGVCLLNSDDVILSGNKVYGNVASGDPLIFSGPGGGGVSALSATVTLSDNLIYSNTAFFGGGGGLSALSAAVAVDGNAIYSNTSFAGGGGGVHTLGTTTTLNGNAIYGNIAFVGGGGVYLEASDGAILSDNDIHNNLAVDVDSSGGGVILLAGSDGAVLSRNAIYSNAADYGGGVKLWESDDATLDGNVIYSNTAGFGGGGGVEVFFSHNATLSGNLIYSNTALMEGGGVEVWESAGVRLDNNVIAANRAVTAGSGVNVYSSTADLRHNTIARNPGVAAGLCISNSTVALTNTILVSHSVGISVAADSTATLDYTLWGDGVWVNVVLTDGLGTITVTNSITGLPDFVNPNGMNYDIGSNSKAIDAGRDAGVYADIKGRPRPYYVGYDVGAYEYAPADLIVHKTVTPVTASPGDAITYTLTFSNAGWDPATGVVITDVVPVSVTVKGIISTGVTITDTFTSPTYTWRVQDMARDNVGVITITGWLSKPLAAGVFTNTAEITTTTSVDGDAGNNSNSATVTVLPADLVIVKTVTPTSSVNPGGAVTYTLTFSNAGKGLATGVVITDHVPPSVTRGSLHVSSSGADITATGSISYVWEVQDLNMEEWGVITITGQLSGTLAAGLFTNTVTITTTSVDSDTLNDTSSVSVTVQNVAPVADDSTFSTDKDTSIHDILTASDANGDPLTFGIFSNPITGGVTITDTATGNFVYTPTEDAAPYTDTFTFVVTDTSNLTDTAIVTVAVTAEAAANLVIVKTVTPASPVNPGGTVTYMLTFNNTGKGLATGVVITDRVPVSLTHNSLTVSSNVAITAMGSISYVWEVADLASGTGGVITITGVLSDPLPPGVFTNTAAITTTATDSVPGNNSDSASVTVVLPVGGHTEPVSRPASLWPWVLRAAMIAVGIIVAVQSLTRRKQLTRKGKIL